MYEPDFSISNDLSLYTSQSNAVAAAKSLMSGQSRRKILAALDAIDFVQVSTIDYAGFCSISWCNKCDSLLGV